MADANPFEPATRAHALERMAAFQKGMGRDYAARRNYDLGAGGHTGVSQLSPYVRRRLVTEQEIVAHALEAHSPSAADKFVQEVVWRTYWKGWLEQRPGVWEDYRYEVAEEHEKLRRYGDMRESYDAAVQGRTGIAPFDEWVEELTATGYVHNHARMWFASIWIFTLGLPWSLGAEFFYENLLDGDPASNTLSWRWVAGVHTKGRTYLARSSNIAKFTQGRHELPKGVLAPHADPVGETEHPDPQGIPALAAPDWTRRTGLLIVDDDCLPETLFDRPDRFVACATVATSVHRSAAGAADHVVRFEEQALADTRERMEAAGFAAAEELISAGDVEAWARGQSLDQIVMPVVPVGTSRDALAPGMRALEASGVAVREVRREWDSFLWPHATAGFFKLKKQIPALVKTMIARHPRAA